MYVRTDIHTYTYIHTYIHTSLSSAMLTSCWMVWSSTYPKWTHSDKWTLYEVSCRAYSVHLFRILKTPRLNPDRGQSMETVIMIFFRYLEVASGFLPWDGPRCLHSVSFLSTDTVTLRYTLYYKAIIYADHKRLENTSIGKCINSILPTIFWYSEFALFA
jgi:hypothetical protein